MSEIRVRKPEVPLRRRGIEIAGVVGVNEFVGQAERPKLSLDALSTLNKISRVDDNNAVNGETLFGTGLVLIHSDTLDINRMPSNDLGIYACQDSTLCSEAGRHALCHMDSQHPRYHQQYPEAENTQSC